MSIKRKEKKLTDNSMSVAAAGHLGGCKVRDTLGRSHFVRIGKLGGTKVAEQRGSEFYRAIGKLGGAKLFAEKGSEHYSRIGTKGGEALKALKGHGYYAHISSLRRHTRHTATVVTGWPVELRARREAAGLTQGDVAASVGCRVALVSHVECGRGGQEQLWRERYGQALLERTACC